MIRLALLRHGHTAWNRAHRIQGRTDIPLDDAAKSDLRDMRLPACWQHADLWSSPLSRAVETAQLVTGRRPQTDLALTEMDWGDWEGLHGADLKADPASGFRDIEQWGWEYRPPNGESAREVRSRLIPWAQSLTRDTVAVCHIGVMRTFMAQATGWNFDGPAPFSIKRNRLFIITLAGDKWHAEAEPVRLERGTA